MRAKGAALFAAFAMLWGVAGTVVATGNAGTISVSMSPGTIAPGSTTVAFDLTVSNDPGSSDSVYWIGVQAPAGYTITGISPSQDGSGVTASGSKVAASGLAITPGASQHFTVTAAVPAACNVSGTWNVWAETELPSTQPNFPDETSTPTGDGDDFLPYPATTTTTDDASCALAFTTQPANTLKTKSITSVAFSEAGAPVQVAVVDTANSNAVVTSFSGNVGFSINGGTPSQSLSTSAAISGGYATFSGSLPLSGDSYAIGASTANAASATSGTFSIVDGGATCAAGSGCSASATNTGSNTGLGVTAAAGATQDQVTIQFLGTLQCKLPIFNTPYKSTTGIFTVNVTGDRTKTFDVTIPKATAVAAGKPFAIQYHVCFGAPADKPFTGLLGQKSVLQGDAQVALLGSCWRFDIDDVSGQPALKFVPTNPCVQWKYRAANGDIKIRFFAPAGDPKGYM